MLTTPKATPQELPLHFFSRAVSFQVDQEEVGEQIPKLVKRRSMLWLQSAKVLGFILAVYLGLLLIKATCSRYRLRNLQPKTFGRRLAGGDEDDISLPSSPALEALCAEAGAWAPGSPPAGEGRESPGLVMEFLSEVEQPSEERSSTAPSLPEIGLWVPDSPPFGEGRRSPRLVEEFLRQLEETSGEGVPTATAFSPEEAPTTGPAPSTETGARGFSTGAPGSSDDDSGDEQPGPSWAFPRRKRQRAVGGPASDEEPGPSGISSKRARGDQSALPALPPPAEPPLQQAPLTASSMQVQGPSAPVSDDAPSTSAAARGPSGTQPSGEKPLHPFVRRPVLQPGVVAGPWQALYVPGSRLMERPSRVLMGEIRALLVQPSLDASDLKQLVGAVENLARFALCRLNRSCGLPKPSEIVRERGLRFLVLEALHSAAQVISPALPPWWPAVVNAAVGDNVVQPSDSDPPAKSFNQALARLLAEALLAYKKQGGAPSSEKVLQIKRMLFCDGKAPVFFRRPEWDPWREDCDED